LLYSAGLPKITSKTITSKTRFLAELDSVRQQGYAICDGETYADLRSLSVPITDSDGSVRAAVSVNGHPGNPVWEDLPGLLKNVEQAARDIARRARIRQRITR